MADNTKIEWCATFDKNGKVIGPGATANLWHGCTKVHEGCDNCYAETFSKRWGRDIWGNDKNRMIVKKVWSDLEKWQRECAKNNHIKTVFVGSMMDIFELNFPVEDAKGNPVMIEIMDSGVEKPRSTDNLRMELFWKISEGRFPNLVFLLLTKRPSNINKMIPEPWKEKPPANVWFGCSVVNQKTANNLIPQLLKVKGNKFLSIEPQLDEIDLTEIVRGERIINCLAGTFIDKADFTAYSKPMNEKVDWIINGGESGHGRRPFDLDWARRIKKHCRKNNVPYFFKQIDKVREKTEGIPDDLQIRQYPKFFDYGK